MNWAPFLMFPFQVLQRKCSALLRRLKDKLYPTVDRNFPHTYEVSLYIKVANEGEGILNLYMHVHK